LRADELVYLGQPNNPTGMICAPADLRALAREHPENLFVVDESFFDFAEEADSLASDRPGNVVVLRSMTKFYAVPGMRVGYAVAEPGLASAIRDYLPPWSLNCFAERFAREALSDEDYAERTRRFVAEQREDLLRGIDEIDELRSFPGEANFVLAKIESGDLDAPELHERMLSHAIAIRPCGNFAGLDDRFFRVAVGTEEGNERLMAALRSEFGVGAPAVRRARKTPALMFQGTSSNAGKSILTAALCRIMLQDGYRVAPFKAQNMSLNSFVTGKGEEMGRAQATQAAACRRDPDVRMNPVLLKPGSDTGSQVIVMGRPVGNMSVEEYLAYKPEAKRAVEAAYASLAAEAGVMVLEGAGSPAEINLKAHDIVNMAMARHARAGVLLIGDIDRGGVFAHFTGTLELLDEADRASIGA
jgi:hypothetical protein